MTEAEEFWVSLLDEVDDSEMPAEFDPSGVTRDTPEWVLKLATEVMTILMPRIQMRVGNKPTPERIGALISNHLVLTEDLMWLAANSGGVWLNGAAEFAKSRFGGFDGIAAMKRIAARKTESREGLCRIFLKVLDRPRDERHRFFRAFSRGLTPRNNEAVQLTNAEKKRWNTLTVYGVVLTNWKQLDVVKTSREAYELLVRLLSVDLVGHDPERIRRMFGRLGKKFTRPGRPVRTLRSKSRGTKPSSSLQP